ncbi:MAG TPA: outer membrane beta-barrel protein [Kofleriaceae bacterium]|nr:outer membrane beta-barrel protein [Kofleriaceae bacterium]
MLNGIVGSSLVFLPLVLLPLGAAAQPPPPPPRSADSTAPEPKGRFEIALLAGSPQGDFRNVDTSFGVSVTYGYMFSPNIGVLTGLRWISVQADADLDALQGDAMFGGRYAARVSPTAKVFGEAMLLVSVLDVEDESESGFGFGLRGGAVLDVGSNIGLGGALSYTTSEIEDTDAAWLTIEGFASFGF